MAIRIIEFSTGFQTDESPATSFSASSISVTPSGDLTSTNVQAALVELQSDIDAGEAALAAHIANTSNPHAVTKSQVGLGNVDNTSDMNKPVSTAQAAADAATLASAQSYTNTAVANLVNTAPVTLDTLNELAAALGNDPNFATTTATALGNRLRVDTDAQGLTGTQKTNAKTNIDLQNVDNTSDAAKNSATATLSNKTLDAPVIDNGATFLHETTPIQPTTGRVRVYPKSDNRLYILDSNNVETPVGSGTAAGFVNYITNPDAESVVTPWATYADASQATPVDGTGGSPTVAWQRNSTNPLRGSADFAFVKDANNRRGEGVAFPFTIATTDRGKKHQISFDFDTVKTNYAAGDLRVYVYDVTNATLITPQVVDVPRATSTFLTTFDASTSTSYRLILHVASTNATAYTVNFDNFIVNANAPEQGAAISEWQSYTPTITNGGSATFTTNTGRWRRIGDSLQVTYYTVINAAGSGGSNVFWSLPPGLTADSTKVRIGNVDLAAGTGSGYTYNIESASQYHPVAPILFTTTTVGLLNTGSASLYTGASLASSGEISFTLTIPIAEWAGSGTVNLGAGAQVEYASTVSTGWDSDQISAADTRYGPGGSQVTGSLAATRQKRVFFQYPIQADDLIALEFSNDGIVWTTGYSVMNSVPVLQYSNFTALGSPGQAGAAVQRSGTNSVDVFFGRYQSARIDDGTNVANWTSGFWRVRKAKASSPVGFGRATATDAGLLFRGRFQTKILASPVSGNGSQQTVSGLTFNNLTIGKAYRLSGYCYLATGISNGQNEVQFFDGTVSGTRIGSAQINPIWSSGFTSMETGCAVNFVWVATTTTMTTAYTAGNSGSNQLAGNGTRNRTFLQLEEVDIDSTTAWT